MKKVLLLLLVTIIFICYYNISKTEEKMKAPIAKKKAHITEIHNTKLRDDYHWLRDKKWPKVENTQVLQYLNDENAYTQNFLDQHKELKEQLFEELKSNVKLTDQSVPVLHNGFYYYTRTEEDKNYPIYCRKEGSLDAQEQIILDVNKLAKGKDFIAIGSYSISPDNTLLAFSVDESGSERYTIQVLNLTTGKLLSDKIPDSIGNIIWHENKSGFFYTLANKDWRRDKLFYHVLGSASPDKLIYHETDKRLYISPRKSSSKEYLLLDIHGHESSEYYYMNFADDEMELKLFSPRQEEVIYDIDHDGKFFYIHNNVDAKNFKLDRTTIDNTHSKYWVNYVPEQSSYLSSVDITQNYLILNYKKLGLPFIQIEDLNTRNKKEVLFPDEVYTAGAFSTNFFDDDIRVNYSSLARPDSVYQYNFIEDELHLLKVKEIPGGFDPEEYKVERKWVKSTDGVEVPVSVFYKKSLMKKDGSNPLYLYGYGSYGINVAPRFRGSILPLIERGFVFTIAHIRGGDDLGYEWYKAAKYLTKKRTFEDFIASAQYLIAENYTSKGNIVIAGGSAGGMLVGAALNMEPDLFRAAIAHVPFVDVLNTMLDDSLPLTPGEFVEWGNPKEKEYFDYIKSYSPYDNIEKQAYPHIFVTAGLSDPRVTYWEPAKWVAKLRAMKTDDNLLFLKTNMDTGHQGASGRFDGLKELADEYVFILKAVKN